MPTVQIHRRTGATATPTDTDVTSINSRMNATDAHSVSGTTFPVKIPDAGTNYSYWMSGRLKVTSNTAGSTINNMQWYTDGSMDFGTGIDMNVASASGYIQATGTEGTSGDEMGANHTELIDSVSGAANYASGSTLNIATSSTGTSSTGFIGDWVITQGTVDSTAGVGASSQENKTYQYDVS